MRRALARAGPGDPGQRPDRHAGDARPAASPRPARSTRSARWRRSAWRRVLLAGLTLLPALLTIGGRRGFWPRQQRRRLRPGARVDRARRACGGASATGCCSGPGSALAATVALVRRRRARPARLQGGLQHHRRFFKKPTESVDGFKRARASASRPGALAPTPCWSSASDGAGDAGATWRRRAGGSRRRPGVAAVTPVRPRSRDGRDRAARRRLQGRPVPRRRRSTSSRSCATALRRRSARA